MMIPRGELSRDARKLLDLALWRDPLESRVFNEYNHVMRWEKEDDDNEDNR